MTPSLTKNQNLIELNQSPYIKTHKQNKTY